ncbi:hypothetical protein [Neoroseomonas lacus]|uniref:Membrane protein n=1 Tax=Neoroseomonas lacus TaxID=287609 RepID=A0A917KFC5_9PROT|nr:hypothetical protein [Neoroseomonas lacus]GGJ10118.1 membrane protein [Neoroseomonas lacus]
MIFDVTTLVGFHTDVSLVALVAGVVVVLGMLNGRDLPNLAALFLGTAVITSLTGFLFPVAGLLPSHIFGVVSLLALGIAMAARYGFGFDGGWRLAYVLGVVLATYLDAFIAVVQTFQKVPAANALAPTQSEPPFAIAQGLLLVVFILAAILASRRFRPMG